MTTRRTFLAAAAALPVLGANDRLNLGVIGVGRRGGYLVDRVYATGENLTITSICDTYEGYRLRAKDKVQTKENAAPKLYLDYRELLADKSIDAVVIATPEHLHYRMLLDALKAEYEGLESEEAVETIAGQPSLGHNMRFFSLDLTNTCWTRSFQTGRGTVLVMCQTSDIDLESAEPALRAMVASLRVDDE